MGINLGAFIAPLITGYLGENCGWHWGFGAAAIGMLFGLINFLYAGRRSLRDKGGVPAVHHHPTRPPAVATMSLPASSAASSWCWSPPLPRPA